MAGIRILEVTFVLIERVFEEGLDRFIPVESLRGFKILDVRKSPSVHEAMEMLVESESFPDDESGRTWHTAQNHPPSAFKRWDDKSSLWAFPVSGAKCQFVYDVGGGVRYKADIPDGIVEICGVDLSEPPTALVRRERYGEYEHLTLTKVAPAEPRAAAIIASTRTSAVGRPFNAACSCPAASLKKDVKLISASLRPYTRSIADLLMPVTSNTPRGPWMVSMAPTSPDRSYPAI